MNDYAGYERTVTEENPMARCVARNCIKSLLIFLPVCQQVKCSLLGSNFSFKKLMYGKDSEISICLFFF